VSKCKKKKRTSSREQGAWSMERNVETRFIESLHLNKNHDGVGGFLLQ